MHETSIDLYQAGGTTPKLLFSQKGPTGADAIIGAVKIKQPDLLGVAYLERGRVLAISPKVATIWQFTPGESAKPLKKIASYKFSILSNQQFVGQRVLVAQGTPSQTIRLTTYNAAWGVYNALELELRFSSGLLRRGWRLKPVSSSMSRSSRIIPESGLKIWDACRLHTLDKMALASVGTSRRSSFSSMGVGELAAAAEPVAPSARLRWADPVVSSIAEFSG